MNTLIGTLSHWTFFPVTAYLIQEESEHSWVRALSFAEFTYKWQWNIVEKEYASNNVENIWNQPVLSQSYSPSMWVWKK